MEENELLATNPRPPLFKSALERGSIITAVLIVYTMILYLLNLHAEQWLGYVAIGIMIIAGVKYRDSAGRSPLSYGGAFKFLFLTLLVATVLGAVFNYIYFLYIAPETLNLAIEKSYEDLLDRGMSESQAETQMKFILPWMTPEFFTVIGALMNIFWGVIASLIMAAILKRESTSI